MSMYSLNLVSLGDIPGGGLVVLAPTDLDRPPKPPVSPLVGDASLPEGDASLPEGDASLPEDRVGVVGAPLFFPPLGDAPFA